MIYQKVIRQLEDNRDRRIRGDLVAIPWSLPRLSNVLPGIQQKHLVCITANSKVGKTQLGDFLYMYQPVEWYLANKDKTNIKVKIFYFSLEMSVESKMLQAISYKLFKDYEIIISPQKLQSLFAGYTLDERILEIVKSDEFTKWLEDFESIVTFYNNIRNPFGIFNMVKTYMEANGSWSTKEIDWQLDDGTIEKRIVKDSYIPNDPDEYVIVMTDHLSLISPEKGETLHQAMGRFSSDYCLFMRDKYRCCVVNIQQQSAASEAQQFTMKGETIIDKLKPTADSLGDNKLVGRDVNLMIGLFYPARYGIDEYKGWRLGGKDGIGRNHRELLILLNRDGEGSASLPLYFNGASNYFRELPKIPDDKIYEKINYWNKIAI